MAKPSCIPLRSDRTNRIDDRDDRVAPGLALAVLALAELGGASCAADSGKARIDAATDSGASMCGTPDPTLASGNAAELFAATRVPTFDVYLPKADWDNLKVHARDEQFVSAQACFDGRAVGTVGLRFKGSYGSLCTTTVA